ncbi:hypothetical protein PtA15_7A596 [Puccinia triticina]|uniref:Uncharacterized protein n=1 Tax=Puccinia triticina TaxID=208348 RepID=A0ABY7CSB7_9BASI|nr:uncharacterized protein PtA15_7A596 [Puccinia triticina]WAQ86867.1 hypothetical protein PtA15_7A596 [Puccinia triticina]
MNASNGPPFGHQPASPGLATDLAASLPNPQAPLPALATPAAPPATVPAALGAGPKKAEI